MCVVCVWLGVESVSVRVSCVYLGVESVSVRVLCVCG